MDEKRAGRVFLESIAFNGPATNPRYVGGESRYVKLLTRNGYQIGTVHEIVLPDGSIPHRHPKDYTLRDCTRVRPA